MPLGKQIKATMRYHALLLEYPKSRTLIMLRRIWHSRNSNSLLVGMQNGTATFEDSLVISHETKPTLTIRPSHHVS